MIKKQERDIERFFDRLDKCDLEDGKQLMLDYYRKYPKNYHIMNRMIFILEGDGPVS